VVRKVYSEQHRNVTFGEDYAVNGMVRLV